MGGKFGELLRMVSGHRGCPPVVIDLTLMALAPARSGGVIEFWEKRPPVGGLKRILGERIFVLKQIELGGVIASGSRFLF